MSNLNVTLELAQRGFTPLVLAPLTKQPFQKGYYDNATRDADTLTEVYQAAQRSAEWVESHRATNFARFRDEKTGEITYAPAVAAAQVEDYRTYQPNVGLYLGASRLVVIDVDSPAEYQSWMELCAEFGFDPGPPTIQSPGACRNGVWVHSDGGHWYYQAGALSPVLQRQAGLSNIRLSAKGFLGPREAEGLQLPAFMTNKRLTAVPPSQRVEGFYNGSLETIPSLPEFLQTMVREFDIAESAKKSHRPKGTGTDDPQLIAWEATVDVAALLDGWDVNGADDGCEVIAHPQASTSRSAVVHEPRCRHHKADTDHRLVTFHTVTRPDWVEDALNGKDSCAVSTLYAYKHFDGSAVAMKRAMGFRTGGGQAFIPPTTAQPAGAATTTLATAPTHAVRRLVVTMPLAPRRATSPKPVAVPAPMPTPEPTPAVQTIEEVVSPAPAEETAEDSTQVERDTREIPEDSWNADTRYIGIPSCWREESPLSRLYARLLQVAVTPPSSTIPHLSEALSVLSEPAPLGANEDTKREYNIGQWKVRTDLHASNRMVTTDQLAEGLGVPSHRVRAWMRALIPVAESQGLYIRERVDERRTKQRAAEWNAAQTDPKKQCKTYGIPTAATDTAWTVFTIPTNLEN